MGQQATYLSSSRRLAKVFTHDGYVTKQQGGKLKYSSSFQASASIIHSNVPLAKANHIAKSRFKEWKNRLNLFMGIAANIMAFFALLQSTIVYLLVTMQTCKTSSTLEDSQKPLFQLCNRLEPSVTWSSSFVSELGYLDETPLDSEISEIKRHTQHNSEPRSK